MFRTNERDLKNDAFTEGKAEGEHEHLLKQVKIKLSKGKSTEASSGRRRPDFLGELGRNYEKFERVYFYSGW